MDDLKEWTSLPMPKLFSTAFPRKDWKRISAEASIVCPPTTQSIKGLNGSELCRVDLRLERQHTLHFMITCSSCSVYLPLFLTGAELGFTKRSGQRVFLFVCFVFFWGGRRKPRQKTTTSALAESEFHGATRTPCNVLEPPVTSDARPLHML